MPHLRQIEVYLNGTLAYNLPSDAIHSSTTIPSLVRKAIVQWKRGDRTVPSFGGYSWNWKKES